MNKGDLPNYRKADGEQRCGSCKHAQKFYYGGTGCKMTAKWRGYMYDVEHTYSRVAACNVCDLWEERHD